MSDRATRYRVRPAIASDAALLGAVELAAAQRFAAIGFERIARGRPTGKAEYLEATAAGRLWVIEEEGGAVVGVAIAGRLDGEGYLAEIAVHPDHAGRRLAVRLIDAVESWAVGLGCRSLSLTTFREVPWNRPYYLRLGFEDVEEAELGPELLAQRRKEQTRGLDAISPRVAMRKRLGRGPV